MSEMGKCHPTNWEEGARRPGSMYRAASAGNVDTMTEILLSGSDIGARDAYGNTALHFAATEGHEQAVRLLLLAGANKYETNQHGDSPLDWAYRNNHHNVVSRLLNTTIGKSSNDSNEMINTTTYGDSEMDGEEMTFREAPSHSKTKKFRKHLTDRISFRSPKKNVSGTTSSFKNQGRTSHFHSEANAKQCEQHHLTKPHDRGAIHRSINGVSIKGKNAHSQPAGGQTADYLVAHPSFALPMERVGSVSTVTSGAEPLRPPAPPSLYSPIDAIQRCSSVRGTDEHCSQAGLVLTPNSAANMAFGRLPFNAAISRCIETDNHLGNDNKCLKGGASGTNTSKHRNSLAEDIGTGIEGGRNEGAFHVEWKEPQRNMGAGFKSTKDPYPLQKAKVGIPVEDSFIQKMKDGPTNHKIFDIYGKQLDISFERLPRSPQRQHEPILQHGVVRGNDGKDGHSAGCVEDNWSTWCSEVTTIQEKAGVSTSNDLSTWVEYTDPVTGYPYLYNAVTGATICKNY